MDHLKNLKSTNTSISDVNAFIKTFNNRNHTILQNICSEANQIIIYFDRLLKYLINNIYTIGEFIKNIKKH